MLRFLYVKGHTM